MFERFTDRARQAILQAQEAAVGFGHAYIGCEHLLFGLVSAGTGVAFELLTVSGLDTDVVRAEIIARDGETRSSVSDGEALRSIGIDLDEVRRQLEASFGRNALPSPERPPYTPRARDALERAVRESERLFHGYVGTEHVLLGLLGDDGNMGRAILMDRDIDIDALREAVINTVGADYLRIRAADAKLEKLTRVAVPDHYDVFADVGHARLREVEAKMAATRVFLEQYEAAVQKAERELAARGLPVD